MTEFSSCLTVLRYGQWKNLALLYFLKKRRSIHRYLQPFPLFASIKVTEACNARCITCGYDKLEKRTRELSSEEIYAIQGELRSLNIPCIRFTGGEPLLKKDLGRYLDAAADQGFTRIQVATNGLLLEERSEELGSATHLTVSLDGIGETNDQIRGVPEGFDRAVCGIRRFRASNPHCRVEIATTLVKKNLHQVEALVDLCRELGASWFVNLFDTHLYFFQGVDEHGLQIDDLLEIEQAITVLYRQYAASPKIFSLRLSQIEAIERHLREGRFPKYCILGYTNLDIAANGDIHTGCWVLQPIGNVRNGSIKDHLARPAYKKRAYQMFKRSCRQCTCGWAVNDLYEKIW